MSLLDWIRSGRAPAEPPPPLTLDEAGIRTALEDVVDPELGVDIVHLGLLRKVELEGDTLRVAITPTSPACPVGPWMVDQAREILLERFPTLTQVEVELVWEPPWSPDEMSPEARSALGL